MTKTDWDKLYEHTMSNPIVKEIKDWCDENGVQFEPYARESETNELGCTCCYYGDIDYKKPYLEIKIGDNAFSWPDLHDGEKEVEDEYGYTVEIPASAEDYEEAWDNEMDDALLSHNLTDELKTSFEKRFELPDKIDDSKCISINDFYQAVEADEPNE